MDTASHLLFGATLAGLAMLDPAVAAHSELFAAVLAGTLIGSHAPDLDAIARLKSYAAYVRHHRGVTHSLPALLLWPLAISVPLAWAFEVLPYTHHLFLFIMLAVVLHVLLDWLNAYGVQWLRPLTKRWLHLDVLPLFDPLLFGLHAAGLLIWLCSPSLEPGKLFAVIYSLSAVYVAWRFLHHNRAVRSVLDALGQPGVCQVVPSLHWFKWQFVLETPHYFYTGTVNGSRVEVKDMYPKEAESEMVRATLSTDGVRAFLHFAQRVHVTCKELPGGFEVEWRDMRFWYDHKLPFGVNVRLDRKLNVQSAELGWSKRSWDPPYV